MAFQKFLWTHICTLTFIIFKFYYFLFILFCLDSADRKEDIKDTKTFRWRERDFLQKPGMADSRGSDAGFLLLVLGGAGEKL